MSTKSAFVPEAVCIVQVLVFLSTKGRPEIDFDYYLNKSRKIVSNVSNYSKLHELELAS